MFLKHFVSLKLKLFEFICEPNLTKSSLTVKEIVNYKGLFHSVVPCLGIVLSFTSYVRYDVCLRKNDEFISDEFAADFT
jgi:hypothetical protein